MTNDRSSLRSERIAAIRARLEQARREVIALANGSKKWRMSIPAEPDDTDLVLFGAIDDALAELDRLARDRAELREGLEAAHDYLKWILLPCNADCECVLHIVEAALGKPDSRRPRASKGPRIGGVRAGSAASSGAQETPE